MLMSVSCIGLYGQNFDPTVDVSRTYEGKLVEVHKPYFKMEVPDSVRRFNLVFDYTVTENPYKGTAVFTPYMLDLKPEAMAVTERSLFIRLGAGYNLHPEFDLIWSPKLKGAFRMSVFGSHRSFFGKYRSVSLTDNAGILEAGYDKSRYGGHEMANDAGITGEVGWKSGSFSFMASYSGVNTKDRIVSRHYDAVNAQLKVASKPSLSKHFVYLADLKYSYGEDMTRYTSPSFYGGRIKMHDLSLDLSLGPKLSQYHSILLDVDLDVSGYGGLFSAYFGDFSLTPHYLLNKGRWGLDLGVRLDVPFKNGVAGVGSEMIASRNKSQFVYPDVRIEFEAVRSYMAIYLDVTGGNSMDRYSSQLKSRRRFAPHFCYTSPLLDYNVERVGASLGFKGNISSRFGYDIRGGYSNVASGRLDGIAVDSLQARSSVVYAGYQVFYAALDCVWHSDDVKADASFMFRHTDFGHKTPFALAPAAFTASFNVEYNWKKRIYVGVGCEYMSSRKGWAAVYNDVDEAVLARDVRVPGYIDLSLYFEYRFSRRFSMYAKGTNLLGATIQRTPLYAEGGTAATVGITFNL